MAEELHDLAAAYALDALDEEERARFERHLAGCESCRTQLAELQEAAAALAFAETRPPPPALRERILEAARENGRVVAFPRRRWVFPATVATAAVAAIAAIAVGVWATSLSRDLDRERSAKESYARDLGRERRANERYAQALQTLGGGAQLTRLADAEGALLVVPGGEAALVICGLQPAPEGRTYEAWVIEDDTPRPAGLFPGGSGCPPVMLTRRVPPGSTVAVTLERAGGAPRPTGRILVRSEAV